MITPEQWEKISAIFHSAADLGPEERSAYLDRMCDGDETLRREVESLLQASDEASGFIEVPAGEAFALDISEVPSLTGAYFGHYRIDKSIGRGGMGEVYLATDMRLNRQVALKKLPDKFLKDPLLLRRFRNEAKAAATLNHPNVSTVYSVEEYEGKPFITMEYVQGRTLETHTPPGGLELTTFFDWFLQISEALLHAHERGVTHRDIKPGNIMISTEGRPKILDFGLAQVAGDAYTNGRKKESTITQPGQIIGTPSYMSPEQSQGKDVDYRSDIFSLGVVMYETLTGIRPFTGDSNAELISNLLKSDPPLVSELRPEVPPLVARLVDRCLKKRRRDRIQSMQEIRTILGEAKALHEAGVSSGSLGSRLYRETVSSGAGWRVGAGLIALLSAVLGWYYFSGPESRSPIDFEKMTMRRLSQTNNVVYAQITPDGRSMAYNTIEDDERRALWIRHIDQRNSLQLVPPQPVQYWGGLTISDDGGQVYYITAERASAHGTLYRVSTFGGQPRKLVESVNDLGSLSPDGQRVLFVRYGDAMQIVSANAADGSDERVITSSAMPTIYRDPQFAPDGRSVYYSKRELIDGVEFWSLASLPVGGGTETEILPRQRERISELAVLRDSTGILINAVDPVSNLQQLFHIALPGGKRSRITNDLNYYFGISTDADGRNIIAAQRYEEKRVWVGEASHLASLKPVTREPNANLKVDWTPDGRIVYDGFENNRPHIWISDLDGANVVRLTGPDSDDTSPAVSGDGRFIVFTSTRSGTKQVWRMNVDGSNPVVLATVDGVTSAPRFMPDGQTVIFHWNRGDRELLGRVPVTGGRVEEMPLYGTSYWAISPDGKQVAFAFRDESANRTRVAVRSTGGTGPAEVFDISPISIMEWMPDGRGIYYRERQQGEQPHARVMRMDLTTRKPDILLSVEPEIVFDLTFSRDGDKVAVIRGRLITDAVMLSTS